MLQSFSHILLRTPLQSIRQAFHFEADHIPMFDEGLYLSSPELWQEYEKWEHLTGKEKEKLERSIIKYWLRSTSRSTPYGTFAGAALADITDTPTALLLGNPEDHIRKIRLDMNYVVEITSALMRLPAVYEQVRFFPNNTLYQSAEEWRYVAYAIHNDTRKYHIASVRQAPYIASVLCAAATGATIKELASVISTSGTITEKEAYDFILEMWAAQLLVSGLEPSVTGQTPLEQLLTALSGFTGISDIICRLQQIQALIQQPGAGVSCYENIEKEIKALSAMLSATRETESNDMEQIPVPPLPKNLLQVDLFLSLPGKNVNRAIIDNLLKQVNELSVLARDSRNPELTEFKRRFYARFENREVPLSVALDADAGIGYGGIDDTQAASGIYIDRLAIILPAAPAGQPLHPMHQYALKKYDDYLRNSRTHIELTEDEWKDLKKDHRAMLPGSMALMGSLLKKNGKLDAEHFLFDMASLGGPSAGNLLGRFTHGADQLCAFTKQILAAEEQEHPDALYAEIVHLPQARIGNVLLRPVLRSYEIPYAGLSGAAPDHQIPVADLLVSIRDNEIYLRSRKHGKRVIPRLTTAHNFGYSSLPAYKFLCDLQLQGLAFPNAWDWGPLAALRHLPRVTYKNLILQKAIWRLEEQDIADLPGDAAEYILFFANLRAKEKIPRKVVYKEGDNELLIDFEEDKCIGLLLHYLKRHKSILVEEFLFTEENCIVRDARGLPYAHEMILPLFYRHDKAAEPPTIQNRPSASGIPVKRTFPPGSEWLYFKIYCGAKTAERILTTSVLPFIEAGMTANLFRQFFFIRYRDEEGNHLRIRFYNANPDCQPAVQKAFLDSLAPLLENGTLYRIVLDTYTRELERYDPALAEAAEALFFNDSVAVLRFLDLLAGIEDSDMYRMLFALRGIDQLLDDFGISLQDKKMLLDQRKEAFFSEFGAHASLRKQLNERYRKHQKIICAHMDPQKDTDNGIQEAVAIFEERSRSNAPVIRSISEKLEESHRENGLLDLLPHYLHMFINRLFIAQQRKYELVVYHFLERYYTSLIARTSKVPAR